MPDYKEAKKELKNWNVKFSYRKDSDKMIDLDENTKRLESLKNRLKEVGDSLWHCKFRRRIVYIGEKYWRTFFLGRFTEF